MVANGRPADPSDRRIRAAGCVALRTRCDGYRFFERVHMGVGKSGVRRGRQRCSERALIFFAIQGFGPRGCVRSRAISTRGRLAIGKHRNGAIGFTRASSLRASLGAFFELRFPSRGSSSGVQAYSSSRYYDNGGAQKYSELAAR